MLQTSYAWNAGLYGTGVSLQIIDEGIFPQSADLANRVDTKRSWNKRQGLGGNPSPACSTNGCSHGTFCATLAAGAVRLISSRFFY